MDTRSLSETKWTVEDVAAKLNASNLQETHQVLGDYRERFQECFHTAAEYQNFLKHMFPIFQTLLNKIPCHMQDTLEHKVRHQILDIMERMTASEPLKPYAQEIVNVMLKVLENDNEENGVIAIKIIILLHRVFRNMMEAQTQPFIELVIRLYKNLESTIATVFEESRAPPTNVTPLLGSSQFGGAYGSSLLRARPPFVTQSSSVASHGSGPIGGTSTAALSTTPSIPLPSSTLTSSLATSSSSLGLPSLSSMSVASTSLSTSAGGLGLPPRPSPMEGITTTGLVTSSAPLTQTTLSSTGSTTWQPPPLATFPPPSMGSSSNSGSGSFPNLPEPPKLSHTFSFSSDVTPATNFIRAVDSFKVLSECPTNLIMFFNQPSVQHYGAQIIPLFVKALELRAPVYAYPLQKSAYRDLLHLQVKTLSFLSWFFRTAPKIIPKFKDNVIRSVISLLRNCPGEFTSCRRDLLMSMRYFMNSPELKEGFHNHIDALLEEKVLVGEGHWTFDSLRPNAYSLLSELINSMREKLDINQLARIISIFSRNVHDATLPLTIHTLSVRMILNLVDPIYKHDDNIKGKKLLVWILRTLVYKFGTLRAYIGKVEAAEKQRSVEQDANEMGALRYLNAKLEQQKSRVTTGGSNGSVGPELKRTTSTESLGTVNSHSSTPSRRMSGSRRNLALSQYEINDSIRDIKTLMKCMMNGLKTVVWCILNCGSRIPGPSMGQGPSSYHFNLEERDLMGKFFKWALPCMKLYTKSTGFLQQEIKDIFENFVGVCQMMEHQNLRMTVGKYIHVLYECILYEVTFLTIAQQLLMTSPSISKVFADILITFLMTKITDLAGETEKTIVTGSGTSSSTSQQASDAASSTGAAKDSTTTADAPKGVPSHAALYRLFSYALGSVTKFNENEQVIRPHLKRLVICCLRYSFRARQPQQYYSVLRCLFRVISGGKLDASMKDLLPLLPYLISGLYKLHERTDEENQRDLLVELCLTVPARLSSMIPHLPLLMRLIVQALRGKPELSNLGLRTLEFWIDNLNADYLYPVLSQQKGVLTELMVALTNHLKPPPYPHGALAARLLGKLGGRNRHFLSEPLTPRKTAANDAHKEAYFYIQSEWEVSADSEEKKSPALPLDKCIFSVCALVNRLVQGKAGAAVGTHATSSGVAASALQRKVRSSSSGPREVWETDKISQEAFLNKYKDHAMDFLVTCLSTMIRTTSDVAGSSFSLSRAEPIPGWQNQGMTLRVIDALNSNDEEDTSGLLADAIKVRKQLEQQNGLLREVLKTIMVAGSDSHLEGQAKTMLKGLMAHFLVVISCHTRKKLGANPSSDTWWEDLGPENKDVANNCKHEFDDWIDDDSLSPFELNEALASCFTDSRPSLNELGQWLLSSMVQSAKDLGLLPSGEEGGTTAILAFENLLQIFLKACYSKAVKAKMGACKGVRELCNLMGKEWTAAHELQVLRDLLFILKDQPLDAPIVVAEDTIDAILNVLTICHKTESSSMEVEAGTSETASVTSAPCAKNINLKLIQMFAQDLAHPKSAVRIAVKLALRHLDSECGMDVYGELQTIKEAQYKLLFEKKVQAYQPAQRIGVIDAITFHLKTKPFFLKTAVAAAAAAAKAGTSQEGDAGDAMVIDDKPAPSGTAAKDSKAPEKVKDPKESESKESKEKESKGPHHLFEKPLWVVDEEIMNYIVDVFESSVRDDPGDMSKDPTVAYAEDRTKPKTWDVFARNDLEEERPNRVSIQEMSMIAELPHPIQLRYYTLKIVYQAVLNNSEVIAHETYKDFRLKFITLCFKSITAPCSHIVEVALHGLTLIISINKNIPKEVLHNCLRPVLKNLQNFKFLTVPLLQGLLRILFSLSDLNGRLFNINFPEKLLEHLNNWMDVNMISKDDRWLNTGLERIPLSQEPDIAASIIHLFHLIHPGAGFCEKFLPLLTTATMKLEELLPHYHYVGTSPFIIPLAKFLSRFANEGMDEVMKYFLEPGRLSDPAFCALFLKVLDTEEALDIRMKLASPEGTALLLKTCFSAVPMQIPSRPLATITSGASQPDTPDLALEGMRIIKVLVKKVPRYLQDHHEVLQRLRMAWGRCVSQSLIDILDPKHVRLQEEERLLLKIFMAYCRMAPRSVDVLFELLLVFLKPSLVNVTVLREFFKKDVAVDFSPADKRHLFFYFLMMLPDKGKSQEMKVLALQLIILPMLTATFENPKENNTDVVDAHVITSMMKEAFDSSKYETYSDALRVELLKLATVLILHLSRELVDFRKELIKFGWNHLKHDDSICKYWAYINVCRFFSVYDTPAKIILQVYVFLLRSNQSEVKDLVRTALDILVPALPRRLNDQEFFKAIKYTKKLLHEDGHTQPSLSHMAQIMVTHPVMFYSFRQQFVPQIVNALHRIGMLPQVHSDMRNLTIGLADLIISWEIYRKERLQLIKAGGISSEQSVDSAASRAKKLVTPTAGSVKRPLAATVSSSSPTAGLSTAPVAPSVALPSPTDDPAAKKIKMEGGASVAAPSAESASGSSTSQAPGVKPTTTSMIPAAISPVVSAVSATTMTATPTTTTPTLSTVPVVSAAPAPVVSAVSSVPSSSASVSSAGPLSVTTTTARSPLVIPSSASVSSLPSVAPSEDDYTMATHPSMIEVTLNFLVKTAVTTADSKDPSLVRISKRCVSLFRSAMQLWNHVDIRFTYLVSVLTVIPENVSTLSQGPLNPPSSSQPQSKDITMAVLSCLLDIVLATMESGTPPNTFVLKYINRVQQLINSCFSIDDAEIQKKLRRLLQLITKHHSFIAPPKPFAEVNFYGKLRDMIEKKLTFDVGKPDAKGADTRIGDPAAKGSTSYVVAILEAIGEHSTIYIEYYAPYLMKLAQKLLKDHCSAAKPAATGSANAITINPDGLPALQPVKVMATPTMALLDDALSASNNSEPAQPDENVMTLIGCIRLLSKTVIGTKLVELRKPYYSMLTTCIEKSESVPLLHTITAIIGEWAVAPKSILAQKEKTHFLMRMGGLDRLPEVPSQHLINSYLKIVYQVNGSTPSASHHLHKALMMGLMSSDSNLRTDFFTTFFASTSKEPGQRLQHILRQDWEPLGPRYWLILAVEMFLSGLKGNIPIKMTESMRTLQAPTTKAFADKTLRPDVSRQQICTAHDMLMKRFQLSRETLGKTLLEPLRMLLHVDLSLADAIWPAMLQSAWSSFKEQHNPVIQQMVTLLSKNYHRQSLVIPLYNQPVACHNNMVKVLLESFLSLNPLPGFPADVLGALTVNYNAWHTILTGLRLIETQALSATGSDRANWVSVLSNIYTQLNEQDLSMVLKRRCSVSEQTRYALSLETYGWIQDAQHQYFDLANTRELGGTTRHKISPHFEMELWEDRWIECTKQLSQWPVLAEFSAALSYPELMMEAAWKSHDWDTVRTVFGGPTLNADRETNTVTTKIYEVQIALVENRPSDQSEKLLSTATSFALQRWQQLPPIYSACPSHKPVLHLFHQLWELRESSHMIEEVVNQSKQKQPPNLKNNIRLWRDRLLNKWDSLREWDDIFCWRLQLFQKISATVNSDDPSLAANYSDTSWTMLKLAKIARRQGLNDVCLNVLSKIPPVQMEIQDAFNKLREQVLVCFKCQEYRTSGLNIINNTILDFFNGEQRAELFRLKGIFLNALNQKGDANSAFSHAMQLAETAQFGKGWLTWGKYNDELFEQDQSNRQVGADAMACYLEAVAHNNDAARLMLSKVLWMLTVDEEVAPKVLEKNGKTLPEWVWIPWIPQLLSFLTRPGAPHVKTILRNVIMKYPQAIYYTIRAFFLERREVPNPGSGTPTPNAPSTPGASGTVSQKAGQPTTGLIGSDQKTVKPVFVKSGGTTFTLPVGTPVATLKEWQDKNAEITPIDPTPPTSFNHSEDLMNFFRRAHPALAHEIEAVLEEIIIRFRPKPEEELLSTLHTLLQRCFQSVTMALEDPMPMSLKETLMRVCKKYFRSSVAQKWPFIDMFKNSFEKDFMLEEDAPKGKEGGDGTGSVKGEQGSMMDVQDPSDNNSIQTEAVRSISYGKAPGGPSIERSNSGPSLANSQSGASQAPLSGSISLPSDGSLGMRESGVRHLTLQQVMKRLKKWKHVLLYRVVRKPQSVPLYRCSPFLAQIRAEHSPRPANDHQVYKPMSVPVEIPGQYNTSTATPHPDVHVKLQGFDTDVDILYRQNFFQRRLCMLGNDGKRYYFVAQTATPYVTRSDERVMQLHWMLNRLMEKSFQAKKRSLWLQVPVVVPITPRLRLMEDDRQLMSLGEVYEADRHARGQDPDFPIMLCRERCSQAMQLARSEQVEIDPKLPPQQQQQLQARQNARIDDCVKKEKVAVYKELCTSVVGDDLLARYIQTTLGDSSAIWNFQTNFASQLGITSLLCYAFTCGDRTPHKIVFHRDTARVFASEFRPGYTSRGFLELGEDVPFRFTRNMERALSPLIVEGYLATGMAVLAQAMTNKKEVLQPYLSLMLRDDILSWHASKTSIKTEAEQRAIEKQLGDRVNKNVAKVMDRLESCAPTPPSQSHTSAQSHKHPAVDQKVYELIEEAKQERKVDQMNPIWMPWL